MRVERCLPDFGDGSQSNTRRAGASGYAFPERSVAGSGTVNPALQVVALAELRAGGVWDKQRGELDVSGRAHDVARRSGRGRYRSRPHDAGYRLLLDQRDSRAYGACRKTRLRRRADASAFLLQE